MSPIVWTLTIVGLLALLAVDFMAHVRKAHAPTLKEAGVWSAIFVAVALIFGAGVWFLGGAELGKEYFAGYVTEKALSVDNLFLFLVIMTSFAVPRANQQKVLMFGVIFSLIARTGLILAGAALVNSFSWVFYLFGIILLLTAASMVKGHNKDEDPEAGDNVMVRLARRFIHSTDYYDGDRMTTMHQGRRAMTPMMLVMVAIAGTDVLFAVDSIPAIFGLTQNAYIVFTATAFSLLGLRQLYFLLDGLLDRLVHLSIGLSVILGFIGVKLILHALHENRIPFINGGDPLHVPEVSTNLSLLVILGVLIVTVITSLISTRRSRPHDGAGDDDADAGAASSSDAAQGVSSPS
ncbi:TerC family protein [Acidipropionibacterium virtanenii]|uniref:Putative membrane protein n=1 Tax=Acidipropionibacterium virtanenii TaxID=2057246 RepID=A0A344UX16_9ACTN|nr:TerC family protein [Acidipropionibacterium virtanenii]AXE39814.1 putative membrane protein [Acidipropionibacterium virtanenii]